MLEILNPKTEAFGLDISDLSLKIAKLKKRGKFLNLVSFGEFDVVPGIIKNGEIQDVKALSKIIKDSVLKVKGEKLGAKYVVASLPEEKAFLQVIKMPILKEEELAGAVRYEAENYIPFPSDEVYLDFEIVKPISGKLDHLDLLIAAIPKNIVDSYVQAIRGAGLMPLVLEVESQATSRALIKNQTALSPVLIIDIGATRTGFIIFSGHSLSFTFSIPVCGSTFTEAISKNLEIPFEEANKLKFKYGFSNLNGSSSNSKKKDEIEEKKISDILIPPIIDLTEQIKRYLNYYQSHGALEHIDHDGKSIQKILLCGGGATMKGFSELLYQELKIPVELGNPWINILPEPKKEIPEIPFMESLKYTTALGLAQRGLNNGN